MPSPFGLHLQGLLKLRRISQRQFALVVGMTPPGVSAVVTGRRPFPRAKIAKAVAVLNLHGQRRQQFERWAHLSRMPLDVQEWVAHLASR